MLITRAEVAGRGPLDVRIARGRVAALGPALPPRRGERVIDAAGGALLPGLHDHHLHLFAWAAALRSVPCGPPAVRDAGALRDALRRARAASAPDAWLRGVGYHEHVAGPLDAAALDRLVADRPVRVQHRSGALWIVNGAGMARLGLAGADHPGVERDARGRPTGRVYHADAWLRERLGRRAWPSLATVGERLSRRGVTGVTDATPDNAAPQLAALGQALARGELRQHVLAMGCPALPAPRQRGLARGAVKLVLDEAALPPLDALLASIRAAHARRRPVAIHCVTRAELVLAAAALSEAGARPGDRIEHAALADAHALALLAALPICVVTQPGFVSERGDAYLRDVPADDHPALYRCRGFLDAAIPLAGSTDAPFGDGDPWAAMRAAVERRTRGGHALGRAEALSPEQALALFTSPARTPGAPPRRIAPGARADLCLLDRPWSRARETLDAAAVRLTLCEGRVAWCAD